MSSIHNRKALKLIAKLLNNPIGCYYDLLSEPNAYQNPEKFNIPGILDRYMPRVILSTAQAFRHTGELALAKELITEANSLAAKQNDFLTIYFTQKEAAIAMSIDGNHPGALEQIEKSGKIIKGMAAKYAALYFDYYNSLAFELKELGRVQEARKAIGIALVSPYCEAYPEWHDTKAEIDEKLSCASRSVVYIGSFKSETNAKVSFDAHNTSTLPLTMTNDERFSGGSDVEKTSDEAARARTDEKLAVFLQRVYDANTVITEDMIDGMMAILDQGQPGE